MILGKRKDFIIPYWSCPFLALVLNYMILETFITYDYIVRVRIYYALFIHVHVITNLSYKIACVVSAIKSLNDDQL
jgi:hypothetical protein